MATLDDRDVFKQRVTGSCSPHLPNPAHRTLTTSLLDLPNTLYPVPMAFSNHTNNANFHSSSSTHRTPSSGRRFWEVVLVNGSEEPNPNTRTDHQGLATRPVRTVDSPMNARVEGSFGKSSCSPLDDRCLNHEPADPVSPARRDCSPYQHGHQPSTNSSPFDHRWNNHELPDPVSPVTSYAESTARRGHLLRQQPTTTRSTHQYRPATTSWERYVINTITLGTANAETNTHTDRWGLDTRSGHILAGSSRNHRAEASFGEHGGKPFDDRCPNRDSADSTPPATSRALSNLGHDYTPYLQSCQPNISRSSSDNRCNNYEFADPMSPAISATASTPEHDYSPSWESHEPRQYRSATPNWNHSVASNVAGAREPVHGKHACSATLLYRVLT